MGLIKTLGRYAWRKNIIDGVSSSGLNKPDLGPGSDIYAFVDAADAVYGSSISGHEAVHAVDHTVVAADDGETLIANKATAISFPLTAAVTLGAFFQCRIFNINTGTLTIIPDVAETINGQSSLALGQYEGATIWTDGTTWRASISGANDIVTPTDRTALKAIDTNAITVAYLTEAGREGVFLFDSSDLSTEVAADTQEGLYVSSGDGSAGAWVRIYEGGLKPGFFGATGATDGSDTTALQAALTYASTYGLPIDMGGTWYATSLTISGTAQGFDILGNAYIVGTAITATDAVLEITRGNFTISGAIKANGQRNTDYGCGIWVHNNTSLQYVDLQKLAADGCAIGIRVGNTAYPDALISEVTMSFVSTYSCPKAIQVEGTETYLTILGPQVSADDFGGDAAWQAITKRAMTVIGASVTIMGGEVIQTADTGTDAYIFDIQPLVDGSGNLVWGRVHSIGCVHETAGPLATLHNPGALSGTADLRKGILSLADARGFVSQDSADFIQADSDFDGEVRCSGLAFWAPSARSNNNISFANSAAIANVDDNGFGVNFKSSLAGVSGGIVRFTRRLVFEGLGLPGASISTSQTLVWQSITATGDLARFSGAISSGVFTAPAGGLKDVRVRAQAYVSGVTGSLLILNNGAEVSRAPFNGQGSVEWVTSSLAAAGTVQAYIEVSSGSGTPNASSYLHKMTIEAAG